MNLDAEMEKVRESQKRIQAEMQQALIEETSMYVPDTFIDINLALGLDPGGPDAIRGQGHTTHQMANAPPEAIFVWCNSHLGYARDLARHLGRTDLEIKPPSWLDNLSRSFANRGRRVVLDHAITTNYRY